MPGLQLCQHCDRVWHIKNAHKLSDVRLECVACHQPIRVARWALTLRELRGSLRTWARMVNGDPKYAAHLGYKFDMALAYLQKQQRERSPRRRAKELRKATETPATVAPVATVTPPIALRSEPEAPVMPPVKWSEREDWRELAEQLKHGAEEERAARIERQKRGFSG